MHIDRMPDTGKVRSRGIDLNEEMDSPMFDGQWFRHFSTIEVVMTTVRPQPLGEGPKVMINRNTKGKDPL
jgi:hypothetical protein